jgi:hypothetical protein
MFLPPILIVILCYLTILQPFISEINGIFAQKTILSDRNASICPICTHILPFQRMSSAFCHADLTGKSRAKTEKCCAESRKVPE